MCAGAAAVAVAWLWVRTMTIPLARAAANTQLDAIVVLGHRPPLDAHGLEYETRARVERGLLLYAAGAASRVLFSGGRSTPEVVEADVMAEYALARGVPGQAVLRESESRDTIENARLSVALLRKQLARAPRILLVTSDYHMPRAAKLFRCAGAEEVSTAPVVLNLPRRARIARRTREALVRIVFWLSGACARAKQRP